MILDQQARTIWALLSFRHISLLIADLCQGLDLLLQGQRAIYSIPIPFRLPLASFYQHRSKVIWTERLSQLVEKIHNQLAMPVHEMPVRPLRERPTLRRAPFATTNVRGGNIPFSLQLAQVLPHRHS